MALVHDYLNQRGGAERVVLEMASLWPDAPIYTSLYRPRSTFPEFAEADIRTSPLDRLPVDRGFRNLFVLYPWAFRALGVLAHDVVVSSSSGWAHSVRTSDETFHVVYCYTPARWLYESEHLGASLRARALKPGLGLLRRWDRAHARRADLYIAISNEVAARIQRRYGLRAPVVYPPVDVDRFRPTPRGERLLVVSRLLPYKRVDLVVDAATATGLGLDVVGAGPAIDDLRRRAGPNVTFHGRLPDADVTALMQGCRMLCLPGREDFGLTPVEANAAGKPVAAFAAGGALETVEDGVTGRLFAEQSVESLVDAVRGCDSLITSPEAIARSARRFSPATFRRELLREIAAAMARSPAHADRCAAGPELSSAVRRG